jgi:hypothetical protein
VQALYSPQGNALGLMNIIFLDGRSASERLFEEGVEEAAHDQMLEATCKDLLQDE